MSGELSEGWDLALHAVAYLMDKTGRSYVEIALAPDKTIGWAFSGTMPRDYHRSVAIAAAGEALYRFLDANVGETADWPVGLATDNDEDSAALCSLLNALKAAVEMPRETEALDSTAHTEVLPPGDTNTAEPQEGGAA